MRTVRHPLIVRSRAFRLGMAVLCGAAFLAAVQSWPRFETWLNDYHEIAAELAGPRLAAPGSGGLRPDPVVLRSGVAGPVEATEER